jgi:hypothetical protein
MNKEEKLYKLKNKLEDLLYNLEYKKNELSTYLKESELQINTIKNQLHILNNHLYEKEEIKEEIKEDASEAGEDEEDASEAGEDEEDDEEEDASEAGEDDIEGRIMANIDPNLARLLGIKVQEETKSDWVPPSFSGLHNSQRNSIYDNIYKK